MKLCSSVGLFGALFALPSTVVADQYHYGNLLVGGKAIGYGGAYVALADDQSAMHYNPAGLSFQANAKSASVNTLAFEDTEFKNVYTDGSDFARTSFSVVPGFLGISTSSGRWSYGSYFTVTDYSQERNDSSSNYELPATPTTPGQSVIETVTYDFDNAAYKFGGALSYRLNDQWALGFSLSLKYIEQVLSQTSGAAITMYTPTGSFTSGFDARRRINEKQYLIEPSLSVLYKDDALSVGAHYVHSVSINRNYRSNNLIVAPIITLINGSPDTTFPDFIRTDKEQDQPSLLSFGAAYHHRGWVVSSQIDYYSHVENEDVVLDDIDLTRELKQVTNYSLGLRIPLSHDTALQFGFFTDNSNGVIDFDIPFQRVEAIDTRGISVAYETKLMGYPLTLGVYAKQGDGKVRYADVRYVEAITGVTLYPENNSNDVQSAEKSSVVIFASMDF